MKIYSQNWKAGGLFSGKQSGGGPSTFMGYLGEFLIRNGHELIINSDENYDLHFICLSGFTNIGKSLRNGIPILLRQDGIVAAPNLFRYWRPSIRPHRILRQLSTEIIYISKFCKDSWDSLSGPVVKTENIVHNGARPDVFSTDGAKFDFGVENVILMNENFRHPILQGFGIMFRAFEQVLAKYPNTFLVISGVMTSEVRQFVNDKLSGAKFRDQVNIIGKVSHDKLPRIIRVADVFLHLTANSACSHTVPEALACGLPAILYSGTGPAEFVGESGIVLQSEYEGVRHGFERSPREDPRQLADAIIEILSDKDEYKEIARARAHLFSSDITSQRYLDVFNEVVANPPEIMSSGKAFILVSRLLMARVLSKVVSNYERVMIR